MHVKKKRKAGGAVMVTAPPEILDLSGWAAGAAVCLSVDGGRLVVEPRARARYTLAELLAASDYSSPQSTEDREWIDAPSVGGEL